MKFSMLGRGICLSLTIALVLTFGGAASATPPVEDIGNRPVADESVLESCASPAVEPAARESKEDLTAKLPRFDSITDLSNIELTARELYPRNDSLQREYVEFVSVSRGIEYETSAVPAVVAAAIPVIAACVARGLSGAALDQVINALRGNDLAQADDLIWSFAAGCVGWGPLKWAFNKAKPYAARALTWSVKQALKVIGKFK